MRSVIVSIWYTGPEEERWKNSINMSDTRTRGMRETTPVFDVGTTHFVLSLFLPRTLPLHTGQLTTRLLGPGRWQKSRGPNKHISHPLLLVYYTAAVLWRPCACGRPSKRVRARNVIYKLNAETLEKRFLLKRKKMIDLNGSYKLYGRVHKVQMYYFFFTNKNRLIFVLIFIY